MRVLPGGGEFLLGKEDGVVEGEGRGLVGVGVFI